MHGREPVLPVEAALSTPLLRYDTAENYKSDMTCRLQEAFTVVKGNLQTAQQRQKAYHDEKVHDISFDVGEKVWLYSPETKPGLSKKLTHQWHGPFVVTEVKSAVNYKIASCDGKKNTQVVHVNRLKPFVEPENIDSSEDRTEIDLDNVNKDIVKILDTMWNRNDSGRLEKHYFVQFKDNSTNWIKASDIKNSKLSEEFERSSVSLRKPKH
ncbi:uncharacterized protein [Argopecten irradians]|uniref:uncharacterized protein n=1 Tax=Argopecten irradians TaxID=31199 RepID=UPI00371AF01A